MNSYESGYSDPAAPARTRIAIVGSTGSGKTTLAKALSESLGVSHVELDAFQHGPDWLQTPEKEFRKLVDWATLAGSWIADGNYHIARVIVWPRATMLVWLDYGFPLIFLRLFKRTMLRGILGTELWNGNREKLWRHFFTKESLFLWLFQEYSRRRREITEATALPEYGHLQVLKFRSPAESEKWLHEVITRSL